MKAKHEVEVSGKSIVGRFLEYLQLITSIIANLFTVFGVLVALAVLITGLYPQMVAKNDNHFAKANAGDTYSQMFLAEHFYEIGEYDEAIYWYKIASAAENDYSYYACNNLACLYANGYGLSDYEQSGYRRFDIAVSLFEKAREYGIPYTIHAGEMGDGSHVLDALKMKAYRIGHGINCVDRPEWVKAMADSQIPMEVCVSSNVGDLRHYAAHPVRKMLEAGCKVTLNSDNMMFSRTNIVNEHLQMKSLGISDDILKQCTKNAVEAAFCDEATKKGILKRLGL